MTIPAAVAWVAVGRPSCSAAGPSATASFAKPKSRIFSRSSKVRNRFSGLRSRWTIPFSVSRCQSASDLDTVFHRLAHGKGACAQALPQRLPFEQLLDDVGRTTVRPEIVHGNDVGMVELACGARFLLEATQPVGILGEGFWQDF